MDTVRRETIEDGITLLTLDRPDRLNAMSHELVADIHDALDEVAADRDCRVVIVTGEGRGFCAGLDLKGTGTPRRVRMRGAVPARDWSASSTSPASSRTCARCASR